MFEDLLDSKPESTILSLLLLAPARAFSSTELARRVGMSPQKFRTAMATLTHVGQVKQFTKGSVKYYIINLKYKLLPQIRAAVLKGRSAYEDELFTAIKKLGTLDAAFLSGLFVGHPELPVDMLLVGKVSLLKLEKFLQNCQKMMQNEINYTLMTSAEFKERRNTFDRFIKDIFDYPHLAVVDKL